MKDKTFRILMNVICTILYSLFMIPTNYLLYLYITQDKILSNENNPKGLEYLTEPYIGIPLILIGNTILIVDLYKKYTGKYQK